MTNSLTPDDLLRAPKVLLHDHLDGGVRPRTVVELAAEHGYQGLPTTDVDALSGWFYDAANSGSLERYLETFAHTVGADGEARLGLLAAYVRDKRIPLEMAPTSNVMTGAVRSIEEHPIGLLRRLSFRVTINTDNRLMSGTSMTKEFVQLADAFGWGLDDFRWFTINAMKSAFIPFDQRLALIDGVIKPGYAALQA